MVATKTLHVRTLIIGGGITGLSTAYALEQRGYSDYLVLETQDHLGGLCATTHQDGYRFDYGGHLLHLHTPEGKKIIKQLLGANLQKHTRHAFIYTNGMRVPYPFQQNLWALYPELRALCVDELKHLPATPFTPHNFEQWCLQSFGHGLYEAFFRPYNEKLWGCPLTELTCDWCGPFVPAPMRQNIIKSAQKKPRQACGYNATFYYPKTGGIGALIYALAKEITHVQTNTTLTRVDLAHKIAYTHNKQTIHFEHIVNTIPLPDFVNLLTANAPLKHKALLLKSQPITVYHMAIARPVPHFSWIYCPDQAQPFYRVGLQSGFASDMTPNRSQSLFYIELPGLVSQTPAMEQRIWQGLHQKGIIRQDDVKVFSAWQQIFHAYVLFNKQRAEVVPYLLDALEKKNIYCAGRYGRWEYSFMERSLLEGQQLASKLVKLV